MTEIRHIVTVRGKRQPGHDPQNKQTRPCEHSPECTDATGEHHSFLVSSPVWRSARQVQDEYEGVGMRVTRVEEV